MQIPHSDLDLRPSCCEAKQTFAIIDYKTTKRPSRLAFKTLYSQFKVALPLEKAEL